VSTAVPVRVTRLGALTQIRLERDLKHLPHRVWEAVATEAGLARWFPAIPEWDFRIGGRIEFLGGRPAVITAIDTDHTFAFSWAGELLRFELLALDLGTRLVFSHAMDAEANPDVERAVAGWELALDQLEQVLLISL
jgi:uncharacterized protein YndB with AHSA1/START domain